MNIASVVILYNPTDENIKNISRQYDSDKLFVVNNGESLINNKFNIINNKNKGGIAGGLNVGIKKAFESGFDFVFTFDQDSILPANFFHSMEKFITNNDAELVCPNFFDVNSKTFATFFELHKFRYHVLSGHPLTTDFAISSGMGISQKAWKCIGEFNEGYIIDHVDTEFCLRAKKLNIKIFINFDICLEHAIGNRIKKKLLGITFKPNNHNYIRRYYIIRNGIYLSVTNLFSYPGFFYLNALRTIHEIVCICFFEKDRKKKMTAVIKGIFDGVRLRLGTYH